MKRLTERMDDGTIFVCSETGTEGVGAFTTRRRLPEILLKLAQYEDTGLEPDEIKLLKSRAEFEPLEKITQIYGISLTHLVKLAEAEEDGRLIMLKLCVSNNLFFKTWINNGRECIGIKPHKIKKIKITYITEDAEISDQEIGKTAFCTHEEAEKVLKEREQK